MSRYYLSDVIPSITKRIKKCDKYYFIKSQ